MMKRLSTLLFVLLTISIATMAQVTTSGITGTVMAGGEEAIGATIPLLLSMYLQDRYIVL